MFINLMAKMKRRKCTQRELAERIGVAELTLSRKLNGKREFNLKEMRKIQSALTTSCRTTCLKKLIKENERDGMVALSR